MKKRLTILLLLLTVLTAGRAHADDPFRYRKMGLVQRAGTLDLYYSAKDLTSAIHKRLDSGLPQRIVAHHVVSSPGVSRPVAASGHTCRIVYDLWQAVYHVRHEVFGKTPTSHVYHTEREVLDRCLVMRGFPIASVLELKHTPIVQVESVLELNPLSAKTLARIRRWLAKSQTDHSLGSKSFFGSFVSLFVSDRIGSAERVLQLRSQRVRLRPW